MVERDVRDPDRWTCLIRRSLSVADAPTATAGNGEVTWVATPPSDNGADITSFQWRWRIQSTGTYATVTTSLPAFTEDSLGERDGVRGERARNEQCRPADRVFGVGCRNTRGGGPGSGAGRDATKPF